MADDRDRLLKLHKDLTSIQIPNFDDPEIDKVANTIMEGVKMMEGWLVEQAKKKFTKKT